MMRLMSVLWNVLCLGLAVFAFLRALYGTVMAKDILQGMEGMDVTFSGVEAVFVAATISVFLWLPILVVWAIGALFFMILISHQRGKKDRRLRAVPSQDRIDPKL